MSGLSGGAFPFVGFRAPYLAKDPGDAGTIYVDRQFGVTNVTTTTDQTITLAQPKKAGLYHAVMLGTDGGDLTLTVTGGYNQAAATSVTYGDAGDLVMFYSVKVGTSYYWRVAFYEGTGLTIAEKTVTALTATSASITGALTTSRGTIAAAGSTQADATVIPATLDNVNITGGDASKGAKLTAATVGRRIFVKNNANAVLKVYPDTGAAINELAENAAISMAAYTSAFFVADTTALWFTCPLVPS